MFGATLGLLCCGLLPVYAADLPAKKAQVAVASDQLDEYQDELQELSEWPLTVSDRAHNAFVGLVGAGPEGWRRLFQVQFDVSTSGDLTRRITSFWSPEISEEDVARFIRAWQVELKKRVQNETWALLYAAAYLHCENWHIDRRLSEMERLQKLVDKLAHPTANSEPVLMTVAYLRVRLANRNDFPGHSFPWNGDQQKRTAAVREIQTWWKQHRKEFKEND